MRRIALAHLYIAVNTVGMSDCLQLNVICVIWQAGVF